MRAYFRYAYWVSAEQNCRLTDLETEDEYLWVKLTPRSAAGRELIICTTYRPPSTNEQDFVRNLEQSLSKLRRTHSKKRFYFNWRFQWEVHVMVLW